jgi:3-deoxy-D-manno-octulosonate 8-phosphate phosphatase, YrbI family
MKFKQAWRWGRACSRQGVRTVEIVAIVFKPAGFIDRPFAGRSLAQHALFTARAARPISRTILASSDPDLARLAADADAEVIGGAAMPSMPDRSALLAHVLSELRQRGGPAPVIAVLLDPRFPFCGPEVVAGAVEHLLRCGADSLIAVRSIDAPLWIEDEGGAQCLAGSSDTRRLVEVGALAAVRVGLFGQSPELPVGRTVLYEVPALAALRVDDGLDGAMADGLFRAASSARATARLRSIRMLVLDFDGVMTDNRVLVFEDGREAVLCNRSDGLGLERVRAAGLPLAVISKERNPVVAARCRKLKIACEQGVDDKLTVLQRIAAEQGVGLADVAFIGNDINDLPCLTSVGVAIAPADAYPEVLRIADIITAATGGFGAVREICDLILAARPEAS